VIPDDFGPSIYRTSQGYWENWSHLAEDRSSPFHKYEAVGDGAPGWLLQALQSIDQRYHELGIKPADFTQSADDEWEPIPLDRQEPSLAEAIEALDELAEELRQENGYGASFPEEKRYVLDKLNAGRKRLKEDLEISLLYLRTFVFDPLRTLIDRFKEAGIGILAASARAALSDWLKKNGISFLDGILGP
jgi:hypothetical protein